MLVRIDPSYSKSWLVIVFGILGELLRPVPPTLNAHDDDNDDDNDDDHPARQGLARRAQSKHKRMAVFSTSDFAIPLRSNKQDHVQNRPAVQNGESCDGMFCSKIKFQKFIIKT